MIHTKSESTLDADFRASDTIQFTVEAALLRELGERLVGAPHIALAELIKNAYDADATKVVVRLAGDGIEVVDNGHGMDFNEFKSFWMRVGTTHKQQQRVSRGLKRPMTGSKGVGRLAAQFLAKQIRIHTVSDKDVGSELQVMVNWEDAIRAGDLVKATAKYRSVKAITKYPDGELHGTAIFLTGLRQKWTSKEIVDLARDTWMLQPPFRTNPDLKSDLQRTFKIVLESVDKQTVDAFNTQMTVAETNWYARIAGHLLPASKNTSDRTAELVLQFRDQDEPIHQQYVIQNCHLSQVEFEVRVYYLIGKQRAGISVGDAKDYFAEFGGVHVYDAGFHLPYYGPKTDWLRIEADHAHRLSKSKLLPDSLHVERGLNFLPTQQRLLGIVHVNTPREQVWWRDAGTAGKDEDEENYLKIAVTRDRLIENGAFEDLYRVVRWALDFYAMREAARKFKQEQEQGLVKPRALERFDLTLEKFEDEIPPKIRVSLRSQAAEIRQEVSTREKNISDIFKAQSGLLGSLATAGIAAIAYEHEIAKQFQVLQEIAKNMKEVRAIDAPTRRRLDEIAKNIEIWIEGAKATRALFSPLLTEENRETETRYKASVLIEQVTNQLGILLREIPVDLDNIDSDLRFPRGRYPEWSSIFQNVFINAVNAMLDSREKRIVVSSRKYGQRRELLVQDTGVGVDLDKSDELFEPFKRKMRISFERRELGLGGMGLGLTIVRMIAQQRECNVAFVKPDRGFKTAFSLSWSERE